MGKAKTGREFTCVGCGQLFYRRGSHILRGITRSCGKRECKSIAMSGENNPFWGKHHTPEIRAKIRAGRRAHPPKGTGPKKGVFKHSPEARAKMSAALKERWRINRDKMLAQLPRGEDHHFRKSGHINRYRVCFTTVQKELWQGTKCAYCEATDDLVLDHIIPVMAGGKNVKSNAQTLCGPCNRWKMKFVDLPYYLASLGNEEGPN